MILDLKKIKKDVFLKRHSVFFLGSMLVAFVNFLFHPALGRFLDPSSFGDLQAMLALLNQVSIIFVTFSFFVVGIVSNSKEENYKNQLVSFLEPIVFYVILLVSLISIIFLFNIKTFFNFSSIYPVVGIIFILFFNLLTISRSSFLHGENRFKDLVISRLLFSVFRLLASLVFIFVGFKFLGVIMGIIFAHLITLIFLIYTTKLKLSFNLVAFKRLDFKEDLRFMCLVFFTISLITILNTSDVLLIKHFFNSLDSGLYSGISIISKIIFFALAPSAAVVFSSVKIRNKIKDNLSILKKGIYAAILIGLFCLSIFILFPKLVVGLLFGSQYFYFINLLPKIGFITFIIALVNVFSMYFLALRRFFLIPVSLIGIVGTFLLNSILNQSIDSILNNILIVSLIILSILVSTYAKDYISYRSSTKRGK